MAELYTKAGFGNIKLGVDLGWNQEIMVDGDTIIQLSYDLKTRLVLDSLYQQSGDMTQFLFNFVKIGAKQRIPVTVSFVRDHFLANVVRHQIESAYK